MRVLMFGWEFPPHISGGLGTACFGITQGLSGLGTEIVFVLPRQKGNIHKSHVRLISANDVPMHEKSETDTFHRAVRFRHVESDLIPYAEKGRAGAFIAGKIGFVGESSHGTWDLSDDYGPDMFAEAALYGRKAGVLDIWRRLQVSDHFYYMCTKWFTDGDVHKYFNPYQSPYDAYINYMNILADFDNALKEKGLFNGSR